MSGERGERQIGANPHPNRDEWGMSEKLRFNAELLRAHLETASLSQRHLARLVGVDHKTVSNWLRGGMPGRDNLRKLGEVFDIDPMFFCADPFDMLFSESMTLLYKIFLKERKGDLEIKVTLSGLVRLGEALGVFKEPPQPELELPESVLQSVLPKLEERARAEAQVMQMADENFIKAFVAEHRDKIEALLAADSENELLRPPRVAV